MKILRIGDPHIRPSNIEESELAMEYALSLAREHSVDRIEILGDAFHTHAILRLEVLEFWNKWIEIFSQNHDLVILVGNHDMTGDKNSNSHALSVFEAKGYSIINKPTLKGIYGYLSYQHDQDLFVEHAIQLQKAGAKILICHQTLGGAQYENGFYAPDAIDPEKLPFDTIMSGHIHRRQTITSSSGKKIIYPGTWRWDSISDANEEKGFTIYTHDENGKIVNEQFFSTDGVCSPLVGIEWHEKGEKPDFASLRLNVRAVIKLIGSSVWVKEQKEKLKGRASISTEITDSRVARMPIGTNFEDFIQNVFKTDLDKQKLLSYMKEQDFA